MAKLGYQYPLYDPLEIRCFTGATISFNQLIRTSARASRSAPGLSGKG
jgi:hypothetical protein